MAEVMDMDTHNRFLQAKKNGNWGEDKAEIILAKKYKDVDKIDDLIDFYVDNNILIEVKTCQELINSGNPNNPFRTGRFTLHQEQHHELLTQNGLYLFLVKSNNTLLKAKLIPAEDIHFSQSLTWSMVFS